jgi:hypothetical protein
LTAARDGIRKIGTPGQLKIYDVRKLTEARSNADSSPPMHEIPTAEMASGIERKSVQQNRKLTILSVPRADAWYPKVRSNPHNGHTKDTIGIEETANRQFRDRRKPKAKSEVGDKCVGEEIEESTAKTSGKPAAQTGDQNRKLSHVFARQNCTPKTRPRVGIAASVIVIG